MVCFAYSARLLPFLLATSRFGGGREFRSNSRGRTKFHSNLGGQQKSVLLSTGETPYNVAAHLCNTNKATATVQWQEATGGGGGATQQGPLSHAHTAASQTASPKPTRSQRSPPLGPHRWSTPRGTRPRNTSPGPPRTESRTPKHFESPYRPANSKRYRGPLWVSLMDIHATMGVKSMKNCCALHVCLLTSAGTLFDFESSNVKKEFKRQKRVQKAVFEADLPVFERLLEKLKRVKNTPLGPKNTRASINNHKKIPRQ